jgi:hypothetical protein
MLKDKSERNLLILTILVLGFCFSFRDWGIERFDFGVGLMNFILTTILVAFSVLVHLYSQKRKAKKHNAKITFHTWTSLLATAVVITILTNGYIIFAAVWVITIGSHQFLRAKHKYPHIGPFERAKIVAVGPMSNILLGLVSATLFFRTGAFIWEKLMIINFWFAVMNLFPFFRLLPLLFIGSNNLVHNITYKLSKKVLHTTTTYMEGEIIYFGSRTLALFLFTLALTTSLIIFYFQEILIGIIVGIILSTIIWLFIEWYLEPHGLTGEAPPSLPKIKFGK